MDINDLLTPALLVDLDSMEANLHTMASFFESRNCRLRPHFKNHKSVVLARRQLAAGAIGITTATLPETETLVNAEISSILIANEITGESNLKKLVELSAHATIIAAVDNEKIVNDIARLCNGKKNKLSLVIDIDLGLRRCGIPAGEQAVGLAKKIIAGGLIFDGLMGYEGHLQRLERGKESQAIRKEAMSQLVAVKQLLTGAGIPVNIVSAAGTGSYAVAGSIPGITEVQAGNYLLMDTSYAPYAPEFLPSLSLLTTVISVTAGERFVLNAGIKEISAERGMPALKSIEGATLKALHAEHGIVEMTGKSLSIEAGMNVELSVFYSDGTINLHRKLYGIRKGKVEEIFTIGI